VFERPAITDSPLYDHRRLGGVTSDLHAVRRRRVRTKTRGERRRISGLSKSKCVLATLIGLHCLLVAPTAVAAVTPTGAYSMNVPIDAPPFRGITPTLALEYDSQTGNGMLGVGWRLSGLSEITATSATGGVAHGDSTDKYWIDGVELIPCGSDAGNPSLSASPSCRYALPAPLVPYATRIESFNRIAFEPGASGGRWLVWDKKGIKTTYKRARDLGKWMISDVADRNQAVGLNGACGLRSTCAARSAAMLDGARRHGDASRAWLSQPPQLQNASPLLIHV
jgi:hypothetical protein